MVRLSKIFISLCLSSLAWQAQAASIESFSPQGDVTEVHNIKVGFAESVNALGQNDSADPVLIKCNEQVLTGQAKWLDGKNWQMDFAPALSAGLDCQAQVNPEFLDSKGKPLAKMAPFRFNTGDVSVLRSSPWKDSTVDENQVFALHFNSPVQVQSLAEQAVCAVEGLGEQIPVRMIEGQDRQTILDELSFTQEEQKNVQLIQCSRKLPSNAKLALILQPGLASEGGWYNRKAITLNYEVRAPFSASMLCTRVKPDAPCSPLGDIKIKFSNLIKAEDSRLVKLTVDGQEIQPAAGAALEPSLADSSIEEIVFKGPFAPNGTMLITLPKGLRDDAGNPLSNADKFPINTKLDGFPSLLKFASGNFGIIESYADAEPGNSLKEHPALVPLTVRNIEKDFKLKGLKFDAGKVQVLKVQDDLNVLKWLNRVSFFQEGQMTLSNIDRYLKGQSLNYDNSQEKEIDIRNYSLLAKNQAAQSLTLPSLAESQNEAEVIGVPIEAPGFYVLEASSNSLGKNLTSTGEPMYVRSAVLVTNLAVHLKCSEQGALAWVTRLNDAQPVANAQVQIFHEDGNVLATGKTNQDGIFQAKKSVSECWGVWASARIDAQHPQSYGQADFSFVSSSWNEGIQSWMFNLPNSNNYSDYGSGAQLITHTLLDRTLFRAGETVSMKHYVRLRTPEGLKAPVPSRDKLPDEVLINLVALEEEVRLPLKWQKTVGGGYSAETTWPIPQNSKNGMYRVSLQSGQDDVDSQGATEFRVEEFKLPLLNGTIQLSSEQQVGPVLINPKTINADIQLNYIVGGGAGQLPVQVSAMLSPSSLEFKQFPGMQFETYTDGPDPYGERKVVLDKKSTVLDSHGHVNVSISDLGEIKKASDLIVEVSFMDPNGQIQTISQTVSLMPAARIAGIQAEYAYQPNKPATFKVITLDPLGQIQANVPVEVKAQRSDYLVVRKRLLGGFYTYDYQRVSEDLGSICQGTSDQDGRFECQAELKHEGEISLAASVKDEKNNTFTAQASTYISEWAYWLGLSDTDRMDIIADKTSYQVGEEAVFNVRVPFQEATALVSIEREGVLDYRIVPLGKEQSSLKLKIEPEWAPNAYLSVLSIRGRIRGERDDSGVVWSSEPGHNRGANALVDLAKPSFRLGIVGFSISDAAKELKLDLQMDKPSYQVRQKAKLAIQGQLADGQAAAKANVAVFVVDKALLELSANPTSDLAKAMFRERRLQVETATAQSEVVGRRHYGRKAVPAGGGGGRAPTRELFDSLVYWQGNVVLDEQGRANVEFTLNDSISKFEVVAVADLGQDKFGQASIDFVSKQDLQLVSGLPLLVRDKDAFQAPLTLRNTTEQEMQISVKAKALRGSATVQQFDEQKVSLAPNSATTLYWNVAPIAMADSDVRQNLTWQFDAQANTGARDSIRVKQELISHQPVTIRQSSLMRVDAGESVPAIDVQLPKQALRFNDKWRGGVQVSLQPNLSANLDGVRQFFVNYPYTCFEQRSSVAIGLNSLPRWESLMSELNVHLDEHGLLKYFPTDRMRGSPLLTAYVLSVSADARQLGWDFALPEQAQERMLSGLLKVVNGNIPEYDWMPKDARSRTRLNLIAALARYDMATVNMLQRYTDNLDYPSDSLLDLYTVVQRLTSYPNKEQVLKEINQALLQRLDRQGTQMVFHERDNLDSLWWMMLDRNALQAKLLLTVMRDPVWEKEIPYLVQGLIKSQRQGQWGTTTANLWATLALNYFSATYEKTPSQGTVNMSMAGADYAEANQWEGLNLKQKVLAPWQGEAPAQLNLAMQGKGQVWATVSALAAVESNEAQYAGYKIQKTIEPLSQAVAGQWHVGDTYRVKLKVDANSAMTWVVVSDPIPSGATILGGGLGRDSAISSQESTKASWWDGPSFIERKSDVYRAYYSFMDSGSQTLEYVVRLNTEGNFVLPRTRVEGLYAPETFGEIPNAALQVKKAP